MSTTAVDRHRGGLIDRRLAARVTATRRYLLGAVGVGLAATVCVVVQAALLASVVSDVVLHGATLGAVSARLIGLGAAFVARAALSWAGEAAAQRTSAAVTSTLRRQLLRHALGLGPSWLAGERAGELSLVATRGTDALDVYFGRYLPQAVLAALAPAGILAWVGWENWPSLLILAGLVALVPLAMVFFGRESVARTRRQWRRLSSLSARFLDIVRGLPTLRAFGREAQGRREVAEATDGLRQTTMSTLRVAFLSALALELLAGIGTGLVAMVLGLRLLGGTVSLYSALAVIMVSPEVFLPLRRAAAEFHASTEGQAAADRILSVLDVELPVGAEGVPGAGGGAGGDGGAGADAGGGASAGGIVGGVGWVPGSSGEDRSATVDFDLEGEVLRIEQVTVSFPGREEPAVRSLDLSVHEGEHVALVGPSGAGKSTVVGLLLGFVRPDSGSVLVGGRKLSAGDLSLGERVTGERVTGERVTGERVTGERVTGEPLVGALGDPRGGAAWRRHVSWVPQRPHLVHGTIADNLRLGDPTASDAQLEAVVETVGLGHMVMGLPYRLATPIGDGGLTLSAGERQRLAIARALLRDAPVVLFDEPVAHLDVRSEGLLRDALDAWLAPRTVLVAAHRPELVARIDRVVSLEGISTTGAGRR